MIDAATRPSGESLRQLLPIHDALDSSAALLFYAGLSAAQYAFGG